MTSTGYLTFQIDVRYSAGEIVDYHDVPYIFKPNNEDAGIIGVYPSDGKGWRVYDVKQGEATSDISMQVSDEPQISDVKQQVVIICDSSLRNLIKDKFDDSIDVVFSDMDSIGEDLVKYETKLQSLLLEAHYLKDTQVTLQTHAQMMQSKLQKFMGDIQLRADLEKVKHDIMLVAPQLVAVNRQIIGMFEARWQQKFKFLNFKPSPKN